MLSFPEPQFLQLSILEDCQGKGKHPEDSPSSLLALRIQEKVETIWDLTEAQIQGSCQSRGLWSSPWC